MQSMNSTHRTELRKGNHATGPRYTDAQLAQAVQERRTLVDGKVQSWATIAGRLGIKTPYRLAKKAAEFEARGIVAATIELGTDTAILEEDLADALARMDRLEALLLDALAEKRTSGTLKAQIRAELGI